MALRLRPLQLSDEAAFVAAQRAFEGDHFNFALDYRDGMDFGDYVEHMATLPGGSERYGAQVPAVFLVAVVDGALVGRVSIRHALNEWLAHQGGHIGYGVVPQHRGRGYATEILRQAIIVNRAHGVERNLVTCDDDNVASARTIERCGGQLDSVVTADAGKPVRRYWIE